jgi:hypothetical protein
MHLIDLLILNKNDKIYHLNFSSKLTLIYQTHSFVFALHNTF